MRRIVLILLLTIASLSRAQQASRPWKSRDLLDLHMRLKNSGGAVEGYTFERKGFVAVTRGGKVAVTMPLYEWRIRDGRLLILDGRDLKEEFTLLSMDPATITVRRQSGRIAQFAYTRSK